MKNNVKPVFKLEHARDFCLIHIEIWCRGESTDPRGWTEKQQSYKPHIIFEKTADTVNCYMDDDGSEWIKKELEANLKRNPRFVNKLVKKYIAIYGKTKKIWEKEKTLSHDELINFIKNYREGWPIYEAIFSLSEMIPKNHKNFAFIKKAIEYTNTGGDKADKVLRKSLQNCFPQLGELSSVLLIEEINSNKIPSLSELKKRTKQYIYTDDTLFVDKTLADIEKIFKIKIQNNIKTISGEFRGNIGYPGKVRGIVRKIMSYSKAKDLKDGEILVTAMTTPEFLPALKKANAFITDEGGITCHAAIVAREMKKPCIIGTKIATKVLHDGDLVEVDANKGVVKILKKRK